MPTIEKTFTELWDAGFKTVIPTMPTALCKITGDRAMVFTYDHDEGSVKVFKRSYDGDKSYIEKILRGER